MQGKGYAVNANPREQQWYKGRTILLWFTTQGRACFGIDTWATEQKRILWWWYFILESYSLSCIHQGTPGVQLTCTQGV